MAYPFVPDQTRQDIAAALGQQNDYLQQLATNIDGAHQQSNLISAYRLAAPHLPAVTYQTLAEAGVDPTSPDFASIVSRYMPTSGSNVVSFVNGQVGSKTKTSTGKDALLTAVNPDGSLRFARKGEQGVQITDEMLKQFNPAQGKQYGQQVIEGSGLGGGSSFNPFSGIADAVGSAASAVGRDVLKPALRWASGGLQYPFEVGANALGYLAKLPNQRPGAGRSLIDILWSGTEFGQAVEHGGGSGMLLNPGEDADFARTRAQGAVRGMVTDPSGQVHVATAGRAAGDLASSAVAQAGRAERQLMPWASHVSPQLLPTTKDQTVYNLVSGLVDAKVALKLDPAKPLTEAYQAVRGARTAVNVVSPEERASWGLLDTLAQRLHGPAWDVKKESSGAQRTFKALAEDFTGDAGKRELYRITKGQWTPEMYKQVASESDPEQIKAMLDGWAKAGTIDELPVAGRVTGLGGASYALKRPLRDVRWAAMFPGRLWTPDDPERLLRTVYDSGINAKFPKATQDRLFGEALDMLTTNKVDQPNVYHRLVGSYKEALHQHLAGQSWWEGPSGQNFITDLVEQAHTSPDDFRAHLGTAIRYQFPDAKLTTDQLDELATTVADARTIAATSPAKMSKADQRLVDALNAGKMQSPEQFARANALVDKRATVRDVIAKALQNNVDLGPGYVPESIAANMSRYSISGGEEARRYGVDELHPGGGMTIMVDGEPHAFDGPRYWGQLMHGEVLMENPRTIKQMTSGFHNIVFGKNPWLAKNGTTRGYLDALDAANSVFKTETVIRPALGARMVMSLQANLAMAGHDSIFGEGAGRVLAAVIASKGDELDRLALRDGNNIFGEDLANWQHALGARQAYASGVDQAGNLRSDMAFAKTTGELSRARDPVAHANGWAYQINQGFGDPTRRAIAKTLLEADAAGGVPGGAEAAVQALKDSYWDGALSHYRYAFSEAGGDRVILKTRAGADAYIDTALRDIDSIAAGRPDLLEAMATGKFGGKAIGTGDKADAALMSHLRGLADESIGPDVVIGPKPVSTNVGVMKATSARINRSVDWLFNSMVGKPLRAFSSRPYEQYYHEGLDSLIPRLTDEDRAKIVDALQTGNVHEYATAGFESGKISAKEADLLAKKYAADKMKALMIDLTNKSQFGDAIRLISPFADHWRQLVTKIVHVGIDNAPRVIQRARQVHDFTENNGMFYNDQYGALRFHYPISGLAMKMATGNDMADLTGTTTGLSFATEGLPGIGGTLAVPAAKILESMPHGKDLERRLLPYGAPDISNGVLEGFAPHWFQKFITAFEAPEGQRDFSRQLQQSSAYLLARYPDKYTHDDKGHTQLHEDAVSMTRKMFVLRGIAQLFSPSAPQIDQRLPDKADSSDKGVEAWVLAQEFNKERDAAIKAGGTTADAVAAFIIKHGEADVLALQPQTNSGIYGLGSTRAQADWKDQHGDFAKSYADVWPLFGPNANDDQNFSYYEYDKQVKAGDRTMLTWKERVALAEYRIGQAIYDAQRSRLGPTPSANQRQWLQEVKAGLEQQYPGFGVNQGAYPIGDARLSGDALVAKTVEAAQDPGLGTNDVAEAVRIYDQHRQEALAALNDTGKPAGLMSGSSLSADRAANIRVWLRNIGEDLVKQVPGFAPAWDSVFSTEVQEQ